MLFNFLVASVLVASVASDATLFHGPAKLQKKYNSQLNTTQSCGTILTDYNNVYVYSNGNYQGQDYGCKSSYEYVSFELVSRYMSTIYGISKWPTSDLSKICDNFPAGLAKTTTPKPGDVFVRIYSNGGLTGIVTALNSNGTSFNSLEQNGQIGGTNYYPMDNTTACFLTPLNYGRGCPTAGLYCGDKLNSILSGSSYASNGLYDCSYLGSAPKLVQTCTDTCKVAASGTNDYCGSTSAVSKDSWELSYTDFTFYGGIALSQNPDLGDSQIAVATGHYEFLISKDSGKTWSNKVQGTYWNESVYVSKRLSDVDVSASGQYIYLAEEAQNVWYSSDSGNSITKRSFLAYANPDEVKVSGNGQYVALLDDYHNFYYQSSNYGANFNYSPTVVDYVYALAYSSAGQYVYLATDGYIVKSDDYGKTFQTTGPTGSRTWVDITCSADGQHAVVVNPGNLVYSSHDYGMTWSASQGLATDGYWVSVTMDLSGQYVAIASYGTKYGGGIGTIMLSNDYGKTFTASAAHPAKYTEVVMNHDGTKVLATSEDVSTAILMGTIQH